MIRSRRSFLIAFAAALAFAPAHALAKPGDLDPKFSVDGKVQAGFPKRVLAGPTDLTLQPDGRIVVVATVDRRKGEQKRDLAVVRFTPQGALDKTFSTDGKLIVSLPDQETSAGVALQEDGKIVLGGTVRNDFLVARVTKKGKIDRSFSADGVATADFGLEDDAEGVAVQSDGRIVLAGTAIAPVTIGSETSTVSNFALARFETDGDLDTSFSGDGLVADDLPASNDPRTDEASSDSGRDLALDATGRILIAGQSSRRDEYSTGPQFAVARYLPNGSLDGAFAGSGSAVYDFGEGLALSLALRPGGPIYVGGTADGSFAIARLLETGSLDTGFGGGEVEVDAGGEGDAGTEVAIQSDGQALLAGATRGPNGSTDFALARFNQDGTLDRSFSDDGRVTADFGNSSDRAEGMEVQPDGKIVLAGQVGSKIGLTRHEVEAGPDDFDADGVAGVDDRCPDRYGTRANGCPKRQRGGGPR